MTKQCYRCQEVKPAEAFYKDTSRVSGLSGYCKSCKNAKARTKWREDDAHRAKMLATRAAWGKEHQAELKLYFRQWQLANPDKVAEYTSKRRALLAAVYVEDVERIVVWGRDEGHCRKCSAFVPFKDFHLDHVIPISKGGVHSYYNVQTLCAPCNLSKGAKL